MDRGRGRDIEKKEEIEISAEEEKVHTLELSVKGEIWKSWIRIERFYDSCRNENLN